jgi:hypothetical protein
VAAGITLRRLALVEFSPPPSDAGSIQGVYADVVVETLSTAQAGGALKALLVAACPLDYLPKRTRDGYVVVPSEPRRRCEHAIEAFADLISISERDGHEIQPRTRSRQGRHRLREAVNGS